MEVLNNSIKEGIKSIRSVCFRTTDHIIAEFINSVKKIPSISYYEDLKRDLFMVSLPLSDLKTSIFYPIDEKGISFKDLLNYSNNASLDYQEQSFNKVINTLESSNKFNKDKILN